MPSYDATSDAAVAMPARAAVPRAANRASIGCGIGAAGGNGSGGGGGDDGMGGAGAVGSGSGGGGRSGAVLWRKVSSAFRWGGGVECDSKRFWGGEASDR